MYDDFVNKSLHLNSDSDVEFNLIGKILFE